MYVSRLTFLTLPGKTGEVGHELKTFAWYRQASGWREYENTAHPFCLTWRPDVVFTQDAPELQTLEEQIRKVTAEPTFQQRSRKVSPLLSQSPNREIYMVVDW